MSRPVDIIRREEEKQAREIRIRGFHRRLSQLRDDFPIAYHLARLRGASNELRDYARDRESARLCELAGIILKHVQKITGMAGATSDIVDEILGTASALRHEQGIEREIAERKAERGRESAKRSAQTRWGQEGEDGQ